MSKISGKHYSEDYVMQAANIGMSSYNHEGAARLRLSSKGSSDDGNVQIDGNGGVQILSGDASVAVCANGGGSAMIDGGVTGAATMFAGTPVMPQTISVDGGSNKIVIRSGPLPICPTIELGPTSIKMSVGPLSGIEITPEGVIIKGLMIELNATMAAAVNGLMVTVNGEAEAALQAPMVQIGP